jgi:hypothetical protein
VSARAAEEFDKGRLVLGCTPLFLFAEFFHILECPLRVVAIIKRPPPETAICWAVRETDAAAFFHCPTKPTTEIFTRRQVKASFGYLSVAWLYCGAASLASSSQCYTFFVFVCDVDSWRSFARGSLTVVKCLKSMSRPPGSLQMHAYGHFKAD